MGHGPVSTKLHVATPHTMVHKDDFSILPHPMIDKPGNRTHLNRTGPIRQRDESGRFDLPQVGRGQISRTEASSIRMMSCDSLDRSASHSMQQPKRRPQDQIVLPCVAMKQQTPAQSTLPEHAAWSYLRHMHTSRVPL